MSDEMKILRQSVHAEPERLAPASPSESNKLLEHEYDGIREYDNPTPGWWHLIFLGSVVFSILYFIFWHFSPAGWSVEDAWQTHQTRETRKLFAAGRIENDEASLLKLMKSPDLLNVASGLYVANCATCHSADGGAGGLTGVNLTDDHYKNAKKLTDLYTVITNGANNGAMPSWKTISDKERVLLAAYVASLRGTKPANPKFAEGEVIAPWPTAPTDGSETKDAGSAPAPAAVTTPAPTPAPATPTP
jgi:cytochrome c oxidase cbb3-type subunit 3